MLGSLDDLSCTQPSHLYTRVTVEIDLLLSSLWLYRVPLCAAVMLKWLLKRKSEIIAFYGLKCSVRTVGTHFREKKIILGPPGGARGVKGGFEGQ